MRCLVVYCHPVETSYCAALCRTTVDTLKASGHEVRLIDLYAEGFNPVMDRAERIAYHTPGDNEAPVRAHLEHIKWAEAIVFVYPTWWYGLPAMLKGWLDRVWIPYVTFSLPSDGSPIRGLMGHLKRLAIVTSSGSSRFWMTLVGNPGRVTILRGIRALSGWHCRTMFLAHYNIDRSTPETRNAFLGRIAEKLKKL